MRNSVRLLLCCVLVASLAAGGWAKPHRLRFIFVGPVINEAFFLPVKKGLHDAARLMNVDVTYTGTTGVDVKKQAAMVKKAIDRHYDGIAVDMIDTEAFDGVAALAKKRGIPLVSYNTDDVTPNARLATVSQNLYEAGKKCGAAAAPYVPEGSHIIITEHDPGISALIDRAKGIQEVLEPKGCTFTIVYTGSIAVKAKGVVTKALKDNPDVKIVLSTGQADTEGTGLAIQDNFKGKGYWCAGFDLAVNTLKLIQKGFVRFTIDQQPYIQGYIPVIQLALYCRYGIMPQSMDAGSAIITKDLVAKTMAACKAGYR